MMFKVKEKFESQEKVFFHLELMWVSNNNLDWLGHESESLDALDGTSLFYSVNLYYKTIVTCSAILVYAWITCACLDASTEYFCEPKKKKSWRKKKVGSMSLSLFPVAKRPASCDESMMNKYCNNRVSSCCCCQR